MSLDLFAPASTFRDGGVAVNPAQPGDVTRALHWRWRSRRDLRWTLSCIAHAAGRQWRNVRAR